MVKHIVLFQLQAGLEPALKQEVMETFRRRILELPLKLSIIRHIEVGFNCNADEAWDICLNSDFDTMDDVRTYSHFPDHVAAASALKHYVQQRACVDYQED